MIICRIVSCMCRYVCWVGVCVSMKVTTRLTFSHTHVTIYTPMNAYAIFMSCKIHVCFSCSLSHPHPDRNKFFYLNDLLFDYLHFFMPFISFVLIWILHFSCIIFIKMLPKILLITFFSNAIADVLSKRLQQINDKNNLQSALQNSTSQGFTIIFPFIFCWYLG